MTMRYLSLFSGIEAATVAWHPLGWECVGVAEIEPFPCAVLAHHYPNVPNLGSVTDITEQQVKALGHIDIVVFGSPCQDLSVAGHRKGLINADGTVTRSGLFFTAINIARWSGARFWLWENVPGAFSSNKGRDFAAVVEFMAGLDECPIPPRGWATEGVAVGDNGLLEWACLDAQWFGVAQRRRRVFALLDTGDWANRPPILLEPESLRGDSAPSREKGEGFTHPVAPCLDASFGRLQGTSGQDAKHGHGHLVCIGSGQAGAEIRVDGGAPTLTCLHEAPVVAFHPTQDPISSIDGSTHAMGCGSKQGQASIAVAVAFQLNGDRDNPGVSVSEGVAFCLPANPMSDRGQAVSAAMQVRRLTPIECERLQGFPDDYTNIPWRGKNESPDGPRYKALGNSMAVPVMRWIGKQIDGALLI